MKSNTAIICARAWAGMLLARALLSFVMLACAGHGKVSGGEDERSSFSRSNLPAAAQVAITWNFDATTVGGPPAGFSFGRTDFRFPVAVEDSASFGDASLSVRCKPVSGRVDQACGIVWRYRDENDYYLARANALEDNVNFYCVEHGRRREVKGWSGKVASGVWHPLRADMRGDHVEIYIDGTKVIDARDTRFPAPGKVGVWTKADSQTLFDDLTASPLGS